MTRRTNSLLQSTLAVLLVLIFATTALAGPPLICHPFQIGSAKSLPWNGTAWDLAGNENYDTHNLVRDTLAILDSNAPVLVRVETLRRATLYARKDPQAGQELFTRLMARTTGKGEALAWFDAGYLAASYNQWLTHDPHNPAAGVDGYSMVSKALSVRGNDPQMEFAAAMMTLHGPQKNHAEHTQKAITGSKTDALLAQNLTTHFLGTDQTVAQALVKGE